MRCELSSSDRVRLWKLRTGGLFNEEISRELSVSRWVVERAVRIAGGISPRLRCRSERALSLAEREEISRGVNRGDSYRAIARQLGRSPSTVSREVKRHGGARRYRALVADRRAWRNARRPKTCRLAQHEHLLERVTNKLIHRWSPEQISKWLAVSFPNDDTLRVSHETIYRSLFVQTRGVFKKEFTRYLRTARSVRRAQKGTQRQGHGSQIIDAVSIRERPAEAEDRAVPGHWEGDLLCGSPGSQIITLVERFSRFVILIKTDTRNTHTVVAALATHIQKLPATLRRSLTWDRGFEMAAHKDFTVATEVKVYFCDPYSPWQRGSNENTNGLLRQYLPKGTDLSTYSQRQLDEIAAELNDRPRKTLGFASPIDTLRRTLGVALTH